MRTIFWIIGSIICAMIGCLCGDAVKTRWIRKDPSSASRFFGV